MAYVKCWTKRQILVVVIMPDISLNTAQWLYCSMRFIVTRPQVHIPVSCILLMAEISQHYYHLIYYQTNRLGAWRSTMQLCSTQTNEALNSWSFNNKLDYRPQELYNFVPGWWFFKVQIDIAIQEKSRSGKLTFSNRFCHCSSLCLIRSIQCDSVASMPIVVALNVNASPLKSIPMVWGTKARLWWSE